MTQTDPTPGAEPSRREALSSVSFSMEQVKPKLRGWLHVGMTPVALVSGIILIVLAGTTREKVSAAVFTGSAVLLFGTSAVYHRGTWSPRVGGFLRRFDHSNIFLMIAGTYTPFALSCRPTRLDGSCSSCGVVHCSRDVPRVLVGAPRWLYVPAYLMLGWVAVFYFGPLLQHAGAAVMTWVVIGGALYSLGAIVYGTKRPDLSPRWFGFHEVFHALTILAFTAHFVAASLALTGPAIV